MKIKIYGLGWVGKSMKEMFPGAIVHDPALGLISTEKANIAFVCVPTPLKDGRVDGSIVEEVVKNAPEELIVMRSTVMPGTCDYLELEYGKRIVFQPEYLGETQAHPFLNQGSRQFMILGGRQDDVEEVIKVYQLVYNANISIRKTTAYEAEVIKLSENRAIGYKVAQCQELYDACKAAGIDYNTIREAVYGDDPRFNLWFTFVYPDKRGFGGKCVVPNTKIYTNEGFKLAKDIKLGELLLTHDGTFQKVTEIMERDVTEKLISITPQGMDSFILTKEHPVLGLKTNRKYWGQTRKKLSNYYGSYGIDWIEAGQLSKGDFISVPNINLKKEKILNDDLMRLIGYYIAEGHCDGGKVTFGFHIRETEYIEDIKAIVLKNYPIKEPRRYQRTSDTNVREYKKKNMHNLTFFNHELSDFLIKYGGHLHNHKKIHEEILFSSNISELFKGYFRGDGSQSGGTLVVATTSEELFYQIKLILWAFDICPLMNISKERVDKDGITHKKAYYIRIRNYLDIQKFNKHFEFNLIKELKLTRNTTPRVDNKILIPIKSINEIEYSGKVINFEVANNHTYVVADAIVHNCLSKDIPAWAAWAESVGASNELTTAMLSYNEKLIKEK